jgi:hypothetical protein
VVPRQFLRILIDVLDRVKQHEAYEPREHHKLVIDEEDLQPQERAARAQASPEIESTEPPTRRRLDG